MTAQPPALEWDLDAPALEPAGRGPSAARRRMPTSGALVAAVVALALGVLAGGSLRAGTGPAVGSQGALPAARLGLLDVRLEWGPIIILRLTVTNEDTSPVQLDGLTIAGIQGAAAVEAQPPGYLTQSAADAAGVPRITIALARSVPAGGDGLVDVELRPRCTRDGGSRPVSAQLLLDGSRTVGVPLDGGLDEGGALCRQAGITLPVGWLNPIPVPDGGVRRVGDDLVVTLAGLGAGSRIAGLWAGEENLGTRGPIGVPGPDTQVLRLVRPPGCLTTDSVVTPAWIPTGLRVLVIRSGGGGLLERYAPIGPAFSAWLDLGC